MRMSTCDHVANFIGCPRALAKAPRDARPKPPIRRQEQFPAAGAHVGQHHRTSHKDLPKSLRIGRLQRSDSGPFQCWVDVLQQHRCQQHYCYAVGHVEEGPHLAETCRGGHPSSKPAPAGKISKHCFALLVAEIRLESHFQGRLLEPIGHAIVEAVESQIHSSQCWHHPQEVSRLLSCDMAVPLCSFMDPPQQKLFHLQAQL